MDAHKNFAYGVVAIAPVPALTGNSLQLAAGGGAAQPAVPFNATVWPAGQVPTSQNAEIVRVTAIAGDVLTIARAQEGSPARAILATDQFAATITAKTLTDVEAAVDVVSTALSNEISVRSSQRDLLSQGISVVSQAASAALSVALLASSLAAAETSNRVSANAALAQAVSIVSQALSVETGARAAADNALSQQVSVLSQQMSIASQRLSTLKGGLVSQYLVKSGAGDFAFAWSSVLAGGVGSVTSAQREALSNQVSNLTSAHNTLSNVVSGALSAGDAISADLTSVKSVLAGVSARTTAGTSVHGLQSVVNALSSRISQVAGGTGSVTSTELSAGDQAVSLQAASALSQAVSVLSQRISVTSAGVTSVDLRLNQVSARNFTDLSTLSVAAVGLQSAINALQNMDSILASVIVGVRLTANTAANYLSGVSARTTAGASVKGLQSVVDALSSRMSQIVGGTGSVTSTEVSAGDQAVSLQAASALSQALSVVSQNLSVQGAALSIRVDTQSQAISVLSQLHSALSQAHSVLSNAVSNELSVRAASVQTASAAATSADAHAAAASAAATSVLTYVSGISARTTAGTSVKGLQSVVNALSSRISQVAGGTGSVTSTEVSAGDQAVSLQAASALSQALSVQSVRDAALSVRIDTQSQSVSVLSQQVSVNAATISNLNSAHNALSNQVSDALSAGSAISADVTSIHNLLSALSCKSVGGTSVKGLQSVINALSNRISAGGGGAGSVTSTELSAASAQAASAISQLKSLHDVLSNLVSNALSAGDVASNAISILSQQVSALSQGHSALSQSHSVLSAGLGLAQMRVIQNAQVISATAFTNVSGLSVSVTSAAVYRIEGRVLFTTSLATGTAFGFTYPGGVGPGVMTMEFLAANAGTPGNLTSANYVANRLNESSMSTVATAQMSLVAQLVSATTGELEIYGLVKVSATAGAIQLQAKQSAAGGGVQFLPGSYLQAFRVL
jgi:hypothetical protein